MSGEAARARSVTPFRWSVASATCVVGDRRVALLAQLELELGELGDLAWRSRRKRFSTCSRSPSVTGVLRPLTAMRMVRPLRRLGGGRGPSMRRRARRSSRQAAMRSASQRARVGDRGDVGRRRPRAARGRRRRASRRSCGRRRRAARAGACAAPCSGCDRARGREALRRGRHRAGAPAAPAAAQARRDGGPGAAAERARDQRRLVEAARAPARRVQRDGHERAAPPSSSAGARRRSARPSASATGSAPRNFSAATSCARRPVVGERRPGALEAAPRAGQRARTAPAARSAAAARRGATAAPGGSRRTARPGPAAARGRRGRRRHERREQLARRRRPPGDEPRSARGGVDARRRRTVACAQPGVRRAGAHRECDNPPACRRTHRGASPRAS